jgi:hypothetical protein
MALHDQMQELRDDFAHSAQDVLRRVTAEHKDKKPRKCPEAEIAAPFARSFALGQQYLRSGRELERAFMQVRDLDSLGETQGMTPDYRFKVKRVLELFKQLVSDYREMKVSYHNQLAGEVKYLGCDPDKLLLRAEQAGKDRVAAGEVLAGPEPDTAVVPSGKTPVDEPRTAATVTFYVDNRRCPEPYQVYIDKVASGQVAGAAKAQFRAKAGPHDLCLLPVSDKKACGAPGTVRRAYLHEGFSLALRCGPN